MTAQLHEAHRPPRGTLLPAGEGWVPPRAAAYSPYASAAVYEVLRAAPTRPLARSKSVILTHRLLLGRTQHQCAVCGEHLSHHPNHSEVVEPGVEWSRIAQNEGFVIGLSGYHLHSILSHCIAQL